MTGDRLIAEVERLGARGLPRDDLHRELVARIRRAISSTRPRGRRELRSHIFFTGHLPAIMAQAPLDHRGHLAG
ncbi:MAG TPA: hypothetical protein VES60_16100 [Nakamurella sp.]|nr:hypothetical protein [Nakamurella sp.]